MACPFFYPIAQFEDDAWLTRPRLPLGDACQGECLANPGVAVLPALNELRQFCNTGYARGRCARFPAGSEGPDAVRFSIVRDAGGAVELIYVFEKNYGPLRFGPLVYEIATGRFGGSCESATLEAQARKFVGSYLNRRWKT